VIEKANVKEEKMDLKGKVAIVTGAGQGIGRTTALELAKAGAKLVLADMNGDTLQKVKSEIEVMGGEALAITMDVSKWEDAERMTRGALEKFGRIDILVNNAGVTLKAEDGHRLRILEVRDSDWDRIVDVDMKGVFNCSKAVMPTMMSQRSGRIVNMGSTTGLTGDVSSAPYCAAKAGVMCLTKVFARELGPYQVTVNAVAPGLTFTAMHADTPPEKIQDSVKKTPLGRGGQPIDVARTILFLVSDDLFVNGQTIVVDGGKTMQ
jgi:3-oxoacyl-[acyl-carrier protein] reductase